MADNWAIFKHSAVCHGVDSMVIPACRASKYHCKLHYLHMYLLLEMYSSNVLDKNDTQATNLLCSPLDHICHARQSHIDAAANGGVGATTGPR